MSKKEATINVMWVCVSFGKLVMHSMVSTPFVNIILRSIRVYERGHKLVRFEDRGKFKRVGTEKF